VGSVSDKATSRDSGVGRTALYSLGLMTVYTAPSTRPYQGPFRVISWSAIGLLLGISLFSVYEPEGISRSTNIALAYFIGVILLGAVGFGLVLAYKEAMRKAKQGFQWELTDDKIVQFDKDGTEAEIALDEVKSLYEYHGWLFAGGGEPPGRIAIPADLDGFERIKQDLIARSSLAPLKVKVSPLAYLPLLLGSLSLLFLFFSHLPGVVLISSAMLVLVQAWAVNSLRRIWRARPIPKLFMSSYVLSLLILAWLIFERLKAVL
jgi:hypothetical protein